VKFTAYCLNYVFDKFVDDVRAEADRLEASKAKADVSGLRALADAAAARVPRYWS